MSLTKHQKKLLAALVLLHGVGYTPASRIELARIVFDRYVGLQFKHMKGLWMLGLIEPDIEAAAQLVEEARCTCGCDQWYPTRLGINLAATFKVGLGKMAHAAMEGKYPFHRESRVGW